MQCKRTPMCSQTKCLPLAIIGTWQIKFIIIVWNTVGPLFSAEFLKGRLFFFFHRHNSIVDGEIVM
jgi:hypothetical protein